MMKYLQKLGKALMLPVAVLPICGILMGLGYAFAPGVMGVPGAATSGAGCKRFGKKGQKKSFFKILL